jgi:hypothetical protein
MAGGAEPTVAIVEVGTDSLLPLDVSVIVGVVDGESLQNSELRLNRPGGTIPGILYAKELSNLGFQFFLYAKGDPPERPEPFAGSWSDADPKCSLRLDSARPR